METSDDNKWQPMQTAPRDPHKVVRLKVDIESVRAYWDEDLNCWVLTHPLHIESIREPKAWKRG